MVEDIEMSRYLDTTKAIMEIPLHEDKVKDWFFVTDRCMSDYENSFKIDGGVIIYKKSCNEVEVSVSVDNNTQKYYYYKIVSVIENLLDAIAYNIISSNDKEQIEYMQEFIKRFNEFKGE